MALTMQDGKHVTMTPSHELLTTNALKKVYKSVTSVYKFYRLVYNFMVMHATASRLTAASRLLAPHNSCGNAS